MKEVSYSLDKADENPRLKEQQLQSNKNIIIFHHLIVLILFLLDNYIDVLSTRCPSLNVSSFSTAIPLSTNLSRCLDSNKINAFLK